MTFFARKRSLIAGVICAKIFRQSAIGVSPPCCAGVTQKK